MVRLLGPPIARFCVPRASHDWIHVDETAEGFDVSVDTHSTGRLHGTVDLKGPAGEAVIAIDVHLISPSAQVPASPPSGQAGPAQDDEASSAIGLPEAPPGGEPSGPGPQQPDAGGRAGTAEGHGPAGAPSALQVSRPVDAVTFSPDGTRLATGSRGMAHIWDPQAAAIVRGLPAGRRNRVTALAFSPDGTRLAGRTGQTALIWDATTGEQQLAITHGASSVLALAFSPDGTRLATGSYYENARILDATTGEQQLKMAHVRASVLAVAFSPDGTQLATGASDKTVRIWEITTG